MSVRGPVTATGPHAVVTGASTLPIVVHRDGAQRRNHDGALTTWGMQDGAFLQSRDFGVVSNAWQIVRTGEFDLA
jgi:hypothetical protein